MIRDGSRWRLAPLLGLVAAVLVGLPPGAARAQAVDCTALRAGIDAAAGAGGTGQYDVALRQQRDEIARTRAYAEQTGCGDGLFDDPDSSECRTLARRIVGLEQGLQRLQDQASRGDPGADDRSRARREQFNAACSDPRTDADARPVMMPVDPDVASAPVGPATMPVDPDAFPVPAGPAVRLRVARVLCVRHCDGAYYPLAVSVSSDRMADMDRLCQAQCPASASSAYAGDDAEDVSGALASDGTRYAALAAAFHFRKGPTASCSCRGPQQSWADALAGAEALLEPHKGDVVVTAALSAAMAQPVAPAPKASPALPKPASAAARTTSRKAGAPSSAVPPPASPADPTADVTREFRRSDPTL